MKISKKIGATLAITAMLVSNVASYNAFAAEPTSVPIANVDNSKPLPEAKSEYYNSGFPERISVGQEKTVTPEYIVLDVSFNESVNLDNGVIHYSQHAGTWEIGSLNRPGFVGYISADGVSTDSLSKVPDKTIPANNTAFSIVFKGDSPDLAGSLVKNYSYWKKIISSNVTPTSNTTFVQNQRYGVNNSEALSLAKSSGTSMSIGTDFSASGATGRFTYQSTESLTRTFNKTISVDESTSIEIRHQFDSNDKNRRVALYQYCEGFKAMPQISPWFRDTLSKYYHANVSVPSDSELKTSAFAGVDVEQPQ